MQAPPVFRFIPVLAAVFGLGGCAREALPPEVPGMVVGKAETAKIQLQASAPSLLPVRRGARRGPLGLSIPDGEPCLAFLAHEGVRFESLGPKAGMVTPVAVRGPIGGVRYETAGRVPLVCDCRLVVALDWLGPELLAHGVRAVRHSGAYAYRTTHSGRPSLHAQGLAIDVHGLSTGEGNLEVSKDYVRGSNPSCGPDSPPLNKLACDLGRTGLLEEVITPDDDSDHRDHVHLAIAPL
jgi:hypothetical protein